MSKKSVFITRLTDTSEKDLEGLGTIRQERDKKYRWVQYASTSGAVVAVAGKVANGMAANPWVVTLDRDLSGHLGGVGIGVLMAAIPNGHYGWAQIRGFATLANSTNAVTAGHNVGTGTVDGAVAAVGADTTAVCGFSVATDQIICMFPD